MLKFRREGTIVKLMTEPTKRGRPKSPHKMSQISKAAAVEEELILLAFDYWLQVMGKNRRSVLDEKRRLCIGAAIHDYGLDRVRNSIEGCTMSDFHMGRNKANKKYNDISLILRDAEHIERFLEIYDNSTGETDW